MTYKSQVLPLLRSLILSGCLVVLAGTTQTVQAASPSPTASPKVTATPKPSASPKATVSPTPTASPMSSPSAEVTTQKLKERIERIVEEKREQVKGALAELRSERRGIVGEVTRVSAESITVKTAKTTIILSLNKDVSLVKRKQPATVDAVAVGDWLIGIGQIEDDNFVPEHLVIVTTSPRPTSRVIVLGNVKNITKTEVEVTPRSGDAPQKYAITKTTSYQDLNGNKLTLKNVTAEAGVLVIGQTSDNGPVATIIKVLTTTTP